MGKLIAVIAALFALVWSAPAFGANGSVRAIDHEGSGLFMDNSGIDETDNTVNVRAGDAVEFFSNGTTLPHNVRFDAAQPTSCVQTAGPAVGAVPPLPAAPLGIAWRGNCTFNAAGTYAFHCDAHADMVGKVIVAPNTPPFLAPPTRDPSGDVAPGTSIQFSAPGFDNDGDPLSWAWDFGDGATSTVSMMATHAYAAPGDYTAKVTLSDGRGGTDSKTLAVHVTNRVPTVTAARTPADAVTTGTSVTFTATGSDPDNDNLTYAWDFGDGETGSGASATHAFTAAGSYDAKVTVSDGRGGTASATVPVTVQAPPPPPATTNPSTTTSTTPTTNVAPQNPPTGTLGGKARQKLGASVALLLSGTSDAVTVNATATTALKGKSYRLTPVRNLRVAKGAQAKLTLKVPAALRKAKSLKVKVTVTLTAANGKSATLTKTVTLTR